MAVKIENASSAKLPRRTLLNIEKILESIPREHLFGVDRLRLVDSITDPRVSKQAALPGLYHPRQGTQTAWLEISVSTILPTTQPFHKRLLTRLALNSNLAALIFSLTGQHYYLTLRHSVKRSHLEPAVRSYTEQRLRAWNERNHSIRTRLFKPLQPTLQRWAKSLQKRAASQQKKATKN
ncbi:MAG: hypothetical protein H0T92_12070 [Pyrinomonadaceae bacterium]|nr:hypothetical protein [Pyrinomonadaceae bacterium]